MHNLVALLERRVKRGARVLDEYNPNWFSNLDLSPFRDILSQLDEQLALARPSPGYRWSLQDTFTLGFLVNTAAVRRLISLWWGIRLEWYEGVPSLWFDLEELWKVEILVRRNRLN